LIRLAVAELWRGIGGLAKRTIKPRCELGGIRKNRCVDEVGLVESPADCGDAPSIMSEGAMMSIPARVSETEVRARSSRLASLSIS